MDVHVAILVPMPRISRRALPVDTVALARYLIGRHLVRVSARGRIAGRIVETEAYPPGDPTGYARPGLTTSNAPLFEARGTAYVRMVYGACLTLNLAAEAAGTGAAVLIRALEPIEGIDLMRAFRPASRLRDLARGPGRVCAALGIGRGLSGVDLCTSRVLWLENAPDPRASVQVSTRIGLSRDQHRRLRFIERGSPFVSVPP
jgi:DNA-3-methyladenine glycosylase